MATTNEQAPKRDRDLFTVRTAQGEDGAVLERLWREIDALHARLQPSFFRPPRGLRASRSEHFTHPNRGQHRGISAGPEETLLIAQVPWERIHLFAAQPHQPAQPDLASLRRDFASGDGEGLLCGLIHVQVFSTPPSATMVPRRRAHVEDLVVATWARQKGCGRTLMDEAVRWAQAHDATQMVLTVWSGNTGAEAFYRRLGYRPVSTVLGIELP